MAAAMLVNGCSGGAKKSAGGAGVPVLVAQAVETNVPVLINPPPVGHVMPYSTVTIRPQVGGVISQVHFQEGQEVKKGDLLFTIDPRPMQAALAHDRRRSWKMRKSSSTASKNCSTKNWFRRMNTTPARPPGTRSRRQCNPMN